MSNAGRDRDSLSSLAALDAPVLCVDTCTVLDLLRDPTREAVRPHERQAALSLLTAIESKTRLIGFVADQVRLEFSEHLKLVEEEAVRALKRIRDQITRIEAVAAVYGASGRANLSHLDDYVARSRAVVDRWMAAARSARQSGEIASRALLRLNQVRTPAQKGKDSMKDCVVIETYLDLATALRDAGLSSRIVFASSNTKDYTGEPGRTLKPDLAAEFAKVGIEYAPNFAAAEHLLGL